MKILIVTSGTKNGEPGAVVANQIASLIQMGVDIDTFLVKNGGFKGYIQASRHISRQVKTKHYDALHAHYSFCGYSAFLAFSSVPIICSLMGSDTAKPISRVFTRFFIRYIWKRTIVKATSMTYRQSDMDHIRIIPNGVDLDKFRPKLPEQPNEVFDPTIRNVLFLADKSRPEKNYALAKAACDLLVQDNVELKQVSNIKSQDVPKYIRSADVVLLTSFREGSPNVVKEAMACNVPAVATRVGDVAELFEGASGYYIADFDPQDVAVKITNALEAKESCNGREMIVNKGLDSVSIARRIISIYQEVIDGR